MSYRISINLFIAWCSNTDAPALSRRVSLAVRWLLTTSLVTCLICPATVASAEVTTRDLQIVARTLGFLDPPLTGDVGVGIVFDPASTRSVQEAASIKSLMANGLRVGNLVLKPVLVPLDRTSSANVNFFLLTEAMGSSGKDFAAVAQKRLLPCLTADLEQVRAGNCAVGIQSSPKVEILVNSERAVASNMSFASVFRMMIKEI